MLSTKLLNQITVVQKASWSWPSERLYSCQTRQMSKKHISLINYVSQRRLLFPLFKRSEPQYMCVCVYIHIYMYVCIYTHICMYVYTYMYVCIHMYVCVCIYIYTYVNIFTYSHMCVCVVCVFVCIR